MPFGFMNVMVSKGLVKKNWNLEQANILLKWCVKFQLIELIK